MNARSEARLEPVAAKAPSESLADRWFRFRNRVLSNPRFQRWAAEFPLTRRIARRRASALFDLCAGFVYSQVLHAAVRVRLFEALTPGPQTLLELAPRISLSPEATQRLLDAAASLKLVERRGQGRYGLGVHGVSLVGNPAVELLVEHHSLLLPGPVRPGGPACAASSGRRNWAGSGRTRATKAAEPNEELVARYSSLMASSLALIAEDILEAYPLGRHRCLLDVGGGEGAFLRGSGRPAATAVLCTLRLAPGGVPRSGPTGQFG